jgi:hypothetical protein
MHDWQKICNVETTDEILEAAQVENFTFIS